MAAITLTNSWFQMLLVPKRYVWKAEGEEILGSIGQARDRLNRIIKGIQWTLLQGGNR